MSYFLDFKPWVPGIVSVIEYDAIDEAIIGNYYNSGRGMAQYRRVVMSDSKVAATQRFAAEVVYEAIEYMLAE